MRRTVFLLALLLTACAPVVVTVAPAGGDVLPAEAQRVIDRATATAGAVATQAAQSTARELAARATSTAGAQQTRDTLAMQQTQAALSVTLGAAQAVATDGAGVKTQAVGETRSAATQAQGATYIAQTPTAAAARTQAAIDATQSASRQASAESAAAFWAWLRWTTVALIIALALVICVLVLVRGLAYIRAEDRRAQAATARDAFRLLSPGHWAEWQPGDGYRVYQLPGLLDTPPTVIENTVSMPNRVHAWRHAVRLFAWWGDKYGFGIRELGPVGAGVVTDPAWRVLAKLLKDAEVLADITLPGKKGRATAWAPEWDFARLTEELSSGKLALPFPTQDDPPKVAFAVPNTTPQLA